MHKENRKPVVEMSRSEKDTKPGKRSNSKRKGDQNSTQTARLHMGSGTSTVQMGQEETGVWKVAEQLIDNLAQTLIKRAYPHVHGLQDTQATRTALPDGDLVQILHVNNSHWLTVSTINCLPGTVHIYDSLVGKSVTLDTKVQIARLLQTPLPQITLKLMNIEQQQNGSDCGLYAIATALELCAGNDPTKASWYSEEMRPHLEACLSKQKITTFPKKEREIVQDTLKTEQTKLYCSCRLPERHSEKMVLCCSCGEWFHQKCEDIPNSALRKNIPWTFNTCL